MRKRILMSVLLAAACVAPTFAYDATTVIPRQSYYIYPTDIGSDNNAFVSNYTIEQEASRFYIYDEDFQLVKEFVTLPAPKGEYSYQVQVRKSIPVGATINYEYQRDTPLSIDGVSEGLTIDMVQVWAGQRYEIVTLEDGTQVVADSYRFYYEEAFGKKYPREFYKQVDGLWFLFTVDYYTTYAPYGEWEEPETMEGNRYDYGCTGIVEMPDDDTSFKLTRGIFSDDFNYVYPEFRKVEFDREYTYEDTDIVYRKEWGYDSELYAFKVYDSSNKEVASLVLPEGYRVYMSVSPYFYRLSNKKYITINMWKEGDDDDWYTAVYQIDSNNKVSLMTITPSSTVAPRTPRQGEIVKVTFDDGALASDRNVQVVSASGQVMMQTRVHAGQESLDIDTSRFPQGMYIVTIHAEGRDREAAKIIVR